MENNETFVTEVTENVELTTEENGSTEVETVPEKTFTQSEVNKIVKEAKYRAGNRVRREYERKYPAFS